MIKKILINTAIIMLLVNTGGFSQSAGTPALASASGNVSFPNYQIDWSMGDPCAIEILLPESMVSNTAGSPKTGSLNNSYTTWQKDEVKIIPITGNHMVGIQFSGLTGGKILMVLYDESGRLLFNKPCDYPGPGKMEYINLSSYAASQYFLKLTLLPLSGPVTRQGIYKLQKN
jgi:hypothetical protein